MEKIKKKRKPWSEEQKNKIRETVKRKIASGEIKRFYDKSVEEQEEIKNKIRNTLKEGRDSGRIKKVTFKRTEDDKKQMSIRTKERHKHLTEEKKKEISNKSKETFKKRRELGLNIGRPVDSVRTYEERKKKSDTMKKLHKEGRYENLFSEETHKKISDTMKLQYLSGLRNNDNYQRFYKSEFVEELNHFVRSSWEKEICMYLKNMNVNYEYEKKRFKIEFNETDYKVYIPDLYLIDYDIYIEIKGFWGDYKEKKQILILRNFYNETILIIDSKKYNEIIKNKKRFDNFDKFLEYHFSHYLILKKVS